MMPAFMMDDDGATPIILSASAWPGALVGDKCITDSSVEPRSSTAIESFTADGRLARLALRRPTDAVSAKRRFHCRRPMGREL